MEELRILSLIALFIFLCSNVYAGGAAGAAVIGGVSSAAAANEAREDEAFLEQRKQEGGCVLPLEWAENNSCILEYPGRSDRRVGSFICRVDGYNWYTIIADCQGGVKSVQEINIRPLEEIDLEKESKNILIAGLCLLIIITIMYIIAAIRRKV